MTYTTKEIEALFQQLDVECCQCHGERRLGWICGTCSGSGRQLTRAGMELIGFLERHREQVRRTVERAEIAAKEGR